MIKSNSFSKYQIQDNAEKALIDNYSLAEEAALSLSCDFLPSTFHVLLSTKEFLGHRHKIQQGKPIMNRTS